MPTPEPDPAESHHLEMVCTCSEEGAAAGPALYERVKAGLSRGSAKLRPREVTDRSFWDDCLLSLTVIVRSGPPGAEVQVIVPSDEPTLGLAAIREWFGAHPAEQGAP